LRGAAFRAIALFVGVRFALVAFDEPAALADRVGAARFPFFLRIDGAAADERFG
jgi:hypothetical protein